jgi:hypothetical protein
MGKKEFTSRPPASNKRRVTPSIRKRKRSQEELKDPPRRRSKREQKRSDSTSIPVTPAPPSSIRDSARITTRSGSNACREYTGSTYDLADVLSKRAPSSPEQRQANTTAEKEGRDKIALTNDDAGPRHCYCDEYCLACTSTTPCESHDGFFCSGCDGWFHATCTGWDIHGDPPNRYMESKMYPDFKISLDSLSQEDSQPWYCIRCWEKKKFEEAAFVPWDDCTLDQQAFRLGVEVDSTILPKAMQNRIEKYVDQLRAVIKAETLKGILGSHPRPFPTPKPMESESRQKHALYGRRFELQLLQFSIDTCSCCGRTKPFGTDPWMKQKWIIQGNFQRKHLLDPYHDAYRCNCQLFCKGGQFYCWKRHNQMQLYENEHFGTKPKAPNAKLCSQCYGELTKDATG